MAIQNKKSRKTTEAKRSRRLATIKRILRKINFGFTIYFTDEHGQGVKYYQGAAETR